MYDHISKKFDGVLATIEREQTLEALRRIQARVPAWINVGAAEFERRQQDKLDSTLKVCAWSVTSFTGKQLIAFRPKFVRRVMNHNALTNIDRYQTFFGFPSSATNCNQLVPTWNRFALALNPAQTASLLDN